MKKVQEFAALTLLAAALGQSGPHVQAEVQAGAKVFPIPIQVPFFWAADVPEAPSPAAEDAGERKVAEDTRELWELYKRK